MKYLFLAEKPSTMRVIKDTYNRSAKPIGEIDFLALAGHVCKMSEPKAYEQWDVKWRERKLPMVPDVFKVEMLRPDIVIKVKDALKNGNYDAIIVGTDSDVEGNGIYDLLETKLGLQNYKAYRFFESDLTPGGIMKSIQDLKDYYTNPRDVRMTQAYRIRSRFDWLIGFNMSVAYTVKCGFLMKVGRVKAPTLKLVYDNCAAIDRFQSKTAYQPTIEVNGVIAGMVTADGNAITYPSQEEAEKVAESLSGTAIVKAFDTTVKNTSPGQLYKLTDIQYEAGTKYGYTPEKTLELIQSLYETHRLVSYPRTDGRYVSSEKAKDFQRLIKAAAAFPELKEIAEGITPQMIAAVQGNKRYVNDAEVQKTSHDALIPTGDISAIGKLNQDERNICGLIFRRFLSIFLPPLEEEKSKLILEDNGYLFQKSGSRVLSPGYTILAQAPQETILPQLETGRKVKEDNKGVHKIVSSPPKRLTQASLLKEMENISKYIDEADLKAALKKAKGIGQPSSRASIISELVKTGYIMDSGKKGLFITDEGKRYIENLGCSSIVSPKLSAEWEMHMSNIREGTASYDAVYAQILEYLNSALQEVEHIEFTSSKKQIGICPVCGKPVVTIPKGYGCSGYPNCKFSVFGEIAGRKMSEKEIKKLLSEGTTGELSGFKSRENKPFTAELIVQDGKVTWAPFEKPTKLICPKCKKPVVQTTMSYKCADKGCGFMLWKKICGHIMTEKEAKDLITDGKTGLITDFVSKNGKKFKAYLTMKDEKLELEFQDNSRKTGISCPKCGKEIVKNGKMFKCQACGFSIWGSLRDYDLTDRDVAALVAGKKTDPFCFTSKAGKTCTARLVLREGKTELVFDYNRRN